MTAARTLSLSPVPPFSLELTTWILRRRPDYILDRWDGRTYSRALVVDGTILGIAARQTGSKDAPILSVTATGEVEGLPDHRMADEVIRLLGLNCDLSPFYSRFSSDPDLGPMALHFRGMKPPRYPTIFEALVNGIACQQVSLALGLQLLNRLITRFGSAAPGEKAGSVAFPQPGDLAGADPGELRALGFSLSKARSITEVASAIQAGALDLKDLSAMSDEKAIAALTQFYGVGRWTAEYVLLRGMRRLHLYPGEDSGARNTLRRWLKPGQPLDYPAMRAVMGRWSPYGGLVYYHLLLTRLDESGLLSHGL